MRPEKNRSLRQNREASVLFCMYCPEGSRTTETVHDSQSDAFGRDDFTEYGFHSFFIQPAKGIKKAVRDFFSMLF